MNVIQLTPQSNRAARKMNSAVRERTLFCVVLCCPNFQQSALLIVSSPFQFSEYVSVSNEDSDCQWRFVLFLLNKLGTIHTCCID
jgi:hypothetical protein